MWDGEVLDGEALRAWDEDTRFRRYLEERFGEESYARVVGEDGRRLRVNTFVQQKRRLLIEAGLVTAPPVTLAALPADASDAARKLWPAIELLIRCRVLGGDPVRPLPLARRFLRGWAGMSERAVREAMEQFERSGYIWRAGMWSAPGKWDTTLWHVLLDGEEPTS